MKALLALMALPLAACVTDSAARTGPKAAESEVSDTSLNGMQVLVKRVPQAEMVAVQLYAPAGPEQRFRQPAAPAAPGKK